MRNNKNKLIVLIILLIFISMFLLTIIDYYNYSNIIDQDTKNITRLVSTNIYADIQVELTKPIYVSLTMANDEFLRDWITVGKEQDKQGIKNYLREIKNKYNYDSAFFVSDVTNNYYHNNGILKQIDTSDDHDVWYYDFLDSGLEYVLDIDTDQASMDELTIFINCLIKEKGNVLGVTGVGLKTERIRKALQEYNDLLDLDAYLINPQGIVQVHSDEDSIMNINIFEESYLNSKKNEILSEKDELQIFELNDKNRNEYLITYYIEELDWYLIVEKDTKILRDALYKQILSKLLIFIAAFLLISFISVKFINHYQNKTIKIASTDVLTKVYNRMAFDNYLKEAIEEHKKNHMPFTLLLVDINNFKYFNDTYGHLIGDRILQRIPEYLKRFIRKDDILARWGGDEFTIILKCDIKEAHKIIDRINELSIDIKDIVDDEVTISIGKTEFKPDDNVDSIINRADHLLYKQKKDNQAKK